MSSLAFPSGVVAYDDRRFRGPVSVVAIAWVLLMVPVVAQLLSWAWYGDTLMYASWIWVVPLEALRYVFAVPTGGYHSLGGTPLAGLIPGAAGLQVALWAGAVISLVRWRLIEAGLAMLGLSLVTLLVFVWANGGIEQLTYYRWWWIYLIHALVMAGAGFALMLAGDVATRRNHGVPPAEARAIRSNEVAIDTAARVEARMAAAATLIAPPVSVVPDAQLSANGGVAVAPSQSPPPTAMPSSQTFEYASFGRRLVGRMGDWLFELMVLLPVTMGAGAGVSMLMVQDPAFGAAVGFLAPAIGETALYLIGVSNGQTPGARAVGIRICREDGSRVGLGLALVRMFATALSSLALGIGWLAPLWTPKRQTWQDSIAKTVVIRDAEANLSQSATAWSALWCAATGAGFSALMCSVAV